MSFGGGFKYRPLDPTLKEIRILEIEPSEHGFSPADPVRCRVRHISLLDLDRPRYEAVSYVWGDPAIPKSRIFLEGHEFEVPATSEEVLRRVRRRRPGDKDNNNNKVDDGGEEEEGDDGVVMDMDGGRGEEEEWGDEKEDSSDDDDDDDDNDGWRAIWIDAVCINQTDVSERSQQVATMADIYREARQTVVWLGAMPAGSSGEELQRDLDLVLGDMFQDPTWRNRIFAGEWMTTTTTTGGGGGDTQQSASSSSSSSSPVSSLPGENFRALFGLFNAPWFRRIWVIQEIALAKKSVCMCGDLEISALSILRAAWWLRDKFMDREAAAGMGGTQGLMAATTMQSYSDPLSCTSPGTIGWSRLTIEVFNHVRPSLVTDARDRVYGLLGLMDMEDPNGESMPMPDLLIPDYSKSLAEVYRDATRFSLQGDSDVPLQPIVEYLYHPDDQDIHKDDFPSWVIRWDINGSQAPTPFLSHGYRAAQGMMMMTTTTTTTKSGQTLRPSYQEPNILRLHGFVLDTVHLASSNTINWSDIETRQGAQNLVKEAEDLIRGAAADENDDSSSNNNNNSSYHTDALATTLISSSFSFFETAEPESAREAFDAWLSSSSSSNHNDTTNHHLRSQDRTLAAAARYRDRLHKTLRRRRFFVTTGDGDGSSSRKKKKKKRMMMMGVGPSIMRPGDMVVIVAGAPCPLVLRPSRSSSSSSRNDGSGGESRFFQLLGACYVHGVMDGEAVRRHEESGCSIVAFDVE